MFNIVQLVGAKHWADILWGKTRIFAPMLRPDLSIGQIFYGEKPTFLPQCFALIYGINQPQNGGFVGAKHWADILWGKTHIFAPMLRPDLWNKQQPNFGVRAKHSGRKVFVMIQRWFARMLRPYGTGISLKIWG